MACQHSVAKSTMSTKHSSSTSDPRDFLGLPGDELSRNSACFAPCGRISLCCSCWDLALFSDTCIENVYSPYSSLSPCFLWNVGPLLQHSSPTIGVKLSHAKHLAFANLSSRMHTILLSAEKTDTKSEQTCWEELNFQDRHKSVVMIKYK